MKASVSLHQMSDKKPSQIPAMADTGCQSCLTSMRIIQRFGHTEIYVYVHRRQQRYSYPRRHHRPFLQATEIRRNPQDLPKDYFSAGKHA